MSCLFLLILVGASGCNPLAHPRVSDWRDRVAPRGYRHVFASAAANAVITIERREHVAQITVAPFWLPVPRLVMQADMHASDPLKTPPQWAQLAYTTGPSPPYVIDTFFPMPGEARRRGLFAHMPADRLGPADVPPLLHLAGFEHPARRARMPLGWIDYHMTSTAPDSPLENPFWSPRLVVYTSPTHLVMAALSPVSDGRTELLAVQHEGVNYFADIEASPGRRSVSFPCALIWADWSQQRLATRCRFVVRDFHRWPRSTIRVENLRAGSPIDATYVRTEPITASR